MVYWRFICCLLIAHVLNSNALNVTILHTNDVHSRFVSFDGKMKPCDSDGPSNHTCWGGAARRMTLVKQLRDKYSDVLLLDGGDQFQGTLWYTVLKWKPISQVVSAFKYDAMSFGNHEFDDGLSQLDRKQEEIGLAPYLKEVDATFVSSNLEATDTSPIKGLFKKYHIVEKDNQRYGIVGYITPETASISHPGDTLIFHDEVHSLNIEVQKLTKMGINKIIAIGHSGIDMDKQICQNVAGVDVVVGGHTNTFLYSGKAPSKPVPEGEYPLVFNRTDGRCLVVQDFAFGKYLGFLQVDFDDAGNVRAWNGNPILVNDKFEEDQGIVNILSEYQGKINEFQKTVIGRTAVALNGSRWLCRLRECNFGNIVADAMIYSYLQKKWEKAIRVPSAGSGGWATSAIAIVNSASWRDFEAEAMSDITMADLFNTMVYANTVELIEIKGKHLWAALEHSVKDIEKSKDDPHGKFLQVSGAKVKYDLSKPNGERLRSVLVKCAKCTIPAFMPLIMEKSYNVVTISFVKKGGDGYSMIKDNLLDSDGLETLDIDVFKDYIVKQTPLTTGIEGRITFIEGAAECPVSSAVPTAMSVLSGVQALLVKFLLVSFSCQYAFTYLGG